MSSTTNNSSFTRGAQIWAHNMRMFLQSLRNLCLWGIIFTFVMFTIRVRQYMGFKAIYYLIIERYVQLKLLLAQVISSQEQVLISFFAIDRGHIITRDALEFQYRFWNVTKYGKAAGECLAWLRNDAIFELVIAFIAGSFCGFIFFIYRGRSVMASKRLRGGALVSVTTTA